VFPEIAETTIVALRGAGVGDPSLILIALAVN